MIRSSCMKSVVVVAQSAKLSLPVKDPILDIVIRVGRLIGGLVPVTLNLAKQAILVLLCAFLDFFTASVKIALELVCVPPVVWLDHVVIPVVLD